MALYLDMANVLIMFYFIFVHKIYGKDAVFGVNNDRNGRGLRTEGCVT